MTSHKEIKKVKATHKNDNSFCMISNLGYEQKFHMYTLQFK